jgi:hypothetical protein
LPDDWCGFDALDLSKVTGEGVYVIWHGGQNPQWVRVGMGDIKDRIGKHRNDPDITQYRQFGGLFVTWAVVPAHMQKGIENYLADQLKPLVGERFPNVPPIAVNLPGAA